MTITLLIYVLVSTTCSVTGQLALKHGMTTIAKQASSSVIMSMVLSPWVVGGLTFYGLGVLFWLMALSRLDVSYLYPFASLGYVGVTIGSYFLFKEHINAMRIAGIAIIIFGLIIAGVSV